MSCVWSRSFAAVQPQAQFVTAQSEHSVKDTGEFSLSFPCQMSLGASLLPWKPNRAVYWGSLGRELGIAAVFHSVLWVPIRIFFIILSTEKILKRHLVPLPLLLVLCSVWGLGCPRGNLGKGLHGFLG